MLSAAQRLPVLLVLALACASALLGTQATALAILALVFLLAAAAGRKILAAVCVCAAYFSHTVESISHVHALGYLDEAAVLILLGTTTLPRILTGRPLRSPIGWWWFVLFLCVGLASDWARGVNPGFALTSAFLEFKGPLLALALAQLDWTRQDLRRIAKFGCTFALFALACCLVQIAIPARWSSVLEVHGAIDKRGFIPSLIGPFIHPGELGVFMACVAIAVMAWHATIGRTRMTRLLLWGSGLATLLSFRRKSIVGLSLSGTAVSYRVSKATTLVTVALAVPLLLTLLWGPLTSEIQKTQDEYVLNDHAARTVLLLGSLDVADNYFPLGAGFGRYGSYSAGSHYSPEYQSRGFSQIYGLGDTPQTGLFLTDTMWPEPIGETGWFGALFYVTGLLAIFKFARRCASHIDPMVQWAGLTLFGWSLELAIESSAAAVYLGPPPYVLFFGFMGILRAVWDAPHASDPESTIEPRQGVDLPMQAPGLRAVHLRLRSSPSDEHTARQSPIKRSDLERVT